MIINSAKYGMKLWALQLIPALFPFMILTNLFLWFQDRCKENRHESYIVICFRKLWNLSPNGIYILFLGHICGYPSAAKMISDLTKEEKLSNSEANYLLTIANQSSPAFIESYLINYALNGSDLTISIFLLLYISTFLTSIITRFIYHPDCTTQQPVTSEKNIDTSFFDALDSSIIKSASTCIQIGGYIIFFSVLSAVIQQLFTIINPLNQLLAASLELTYGLSILKQYTVNKSIKTFLILAYFSFGGFCTMAQIKGMLTGTSLSLKPYLLGKCIYTILVLILAILLI